MQHESTLQGAEDIYYINEIFFKLNKIFNSIELVFVHFFKKRANLSQPLQKCKVACFGIPSVISTWVRKHPTHILAGFGSIGVPHSQQRLHKHIRNKLFVQKFILIVLYSVLLYIFYFIIHIQTYIIYTYIIVLSFSAS